MKWQKLNKINLTVIFLFLSSLVFSAYGQSVKIKHAVGEAYIVNISPEKAKETALQNAKSDALRQAGIEEKIISAQVMEQKSSQEDFKQVLSELSSIEHRGTVSEYEIIKDTVFIKNKLLLRQIMIKAEVKTYKTEKDNTFDFSLKGLKGKAFNQGDSFTFEIEPTQNAFANIFLFDQSQNAFIVFPSDYEQKKSIEASKKISFPTTKAIKYVLFKENDGSKEPETNFLIVVLTKKDITFTEKESATKEDILHWINNIEPSERAVKFETITIL